MKALKDWCDVLTLLCVTDHSSCSILGLLQLTEEVVWHTTQKTVPIVQLADDKTSVSAVCWSSVDRILESYAAGSTLPCTPRYHVAA